MAIIRHAMTKEGAIIAITRKQLRSMDKKVESIEKRFIELYMLESDERIIETYRLEFGIELKIVNYEKSKK
jgi:hypothetical protein